MPAKITQEEAISKVEEICKRINFKVEPFQYIGSLQTKLVLYCQNGHLLNDTTYSKFIHRNGVNCRKCLGMSKLTQEEAECKVRNKCSELGFMFEPFTYIGTDDTYLNLTCSKGHKWDTTTVSKLINKLTDCRRCIGTKRYTQLEAENMVYTLCITLNYTCDNFIYEGTDKTNLNLTCDKGHKWDSTTFYHFTKRGSRCPQCSTTESFKLSEIIDVMFPFAEKEKKFDDCVYKKMLPYDRYIPELNLLIEYDGEQHFKYIEFMHKTNDAYNAMVIRDSIKTKYAIDKGFNFIRIAYFENCKESLNEVIHLIGSTDEQIIKIHGKLE